MNYGSFYSLAVKGEKNPPCISSSLKCGLHVYDDPLIRGNIQRFPEGAAEGHGRVALQAQVF